MSNLISRAAAIEAVEILLEQTEEDADVKTWNNAIRGAINSIKHHVPSAQQVMTQMSSADDLISRQAAIEAVEHITSSMSVCVNTDECHGMKRMQRQAVIELTNLRSAQPEIIRCKDCEHWDTTWQNDFAPNYHYCPLVDGTRRDDFYCADAEMRGEQDEKTT